MTATTPSVGVRHPACGFVGYLPGPRTAFVAPAAGGDGMWGWRCPSCATAVWLPADADVVAVLRDKGAVDLAGAPALPATAGAPDTAPDMVAVEACQGQDLIRGRRVQCGDPAVWELLVTCQEGVTRPGLACERHGDVFQRVGGWCSGHDNRHPFEVVASVRMADR